MVPKVCLLMSCHPFLQVTAQQHTDPSAAGKMWALSPCCVSQQTLLLVIRVEAPLGSGGSTSGILQNQMLRQEKQSFLISPLFHHPSF